MPCSLPHGWPSTAEDAARVLLRQGESVNTRLSYGSAMRYWCAWYAARYGHALSLPVPVPVVIQFIVDHAARRHEDGAPDEACQAAHGEPAPPSAGPRLKASALVSELPPEVDQALVKNGYKARLGPPALNTLIHPHRGAVQGASDGQSGVHRGDARLGALLRPRRLRPRHARRAQRPEAREPLCRPPGARGFPRAEIASEQEPAHSLRAGFVTEAGRQNMSLPETMAMTGHHSVATVMGYFCAESALGTKVSRMLDEG